MLTSSPLTEFFGLPDTLLSCVGLGRPWHPSGDPIESPAHLKHLRHAQQLCIKVPHLRRLHYMLADRTDGAPWPCQLVFFEWLWAAIRPIAWQFSKVEFEVTPPAFFYITPQTRIPLSERLGGITMQSESRCCHLM